mgnify:CR=1 FL=1
MILSKSTTISGTQMIGKSNRHTAYGCVIIFSILQRFIVITTKYI